MSRLQLQLHSTFPLLLVFSSLLSLKPISANTELRLLMDLKQSLDPRNDYLKSWTFAGDPCSGFDGVACNSHRKVANISLQGRGLSGRLSPALSGLKCLSGLYLHYNSLTGEIPPEISNLTELTDLYLNVNNLSGPIPSQIGKMQSLQVLQLGSNNLTGEIPSEMGSLKKLTVIAVQYNHLTGLIPHSLVNLRLLTRLDLSYNHLSGPIPANIALIPHLQALDVRNNSLSGVVPRDLKNLEGGFFYANNTGLCGQGFSTLRACTAFDNGGIADISNKPLGGMIIRNDTAPRNASRASNSTSSTCFQTDCSNSSSKFPQIIIVIAVVTATLTFAAAGFFVFFRYRRQKQRIGISSGEAFDSRISTDQVVADPYSKSASPLVSLAYSTGWDPLADGLLDSLECSYGPLQNFRFNVEDVESATHYFSEASVLGRGGFSTVYRGILRDGSAVAIKAINMSSCKAEEDDFIKGLKVLISLRHENLIPLKGICCSRGRGECFLIYELAPNGSLASYLESSDHSGRKAEKVLDWTTRISIIHGIAKGIHYLHSETATKPALVHQNLSSDKIMIDQNFKPLILDSGLRKILADDLTYTALKVSAAMGYLAPEYITSGRFCEKSDVYSFGVIVFQILSGKQRLTSWIWRAPGSDEPHKLEEVIDPALDGKFSICEATVLVNLALACTQEDPSQRPTTLEVIEELRPKHLDYKEAAEA